MVVLAAKNTSPCAIWRSLMVRLFNDKPRDYTEPSRSAESIYAFLDRSSLPEYERMRYMLQRWVDRFPSGHQRKVVGPHAPQGFRIKRK